MPRLPSIAAEATRILVPLGILAAGVGGFLAFGQKPVTPTREGDDHRAALVETTAVEPFDGPIVLDVDGVAEPFRRVTLSAEIDGRITEKSPQCRGGMFVEEGARLAQINPTDYTLEVRRLQAQLRQAQEELASVEVDMENTQELITLAKENLALWARELARNARLSATSAVTEATLDEVRRQELSGRNTLQTHENQLAALAKRNSMLEAARDIIGVNLEQAERTLERTQINSPVAGTVVTSHVEVGDYVRQGDPIVEISEARPMEIRCNLRVEQLHWIWLAGGQVESELSASDASGESWEIPRLPVEVVYQYGGATMIWNGEIFRYEGTGLDPQTRTVPCRVLVKEPMQARIVEALPGASLPRARLFSGMFVGIRIPINSPLPLLSLPQASVRPGNQVWLVRDGRLQIETVEVAKVEGDRVLVHAHSAALQPGDEVVTSPLAAVQDGMPVRTAS